MTDQEKNNIDNKAEGQDALQPKRKRSTNKDTPQKAEPKVDRQKSGGKKPDAQKPDGKKPGGNKLDEKKANSGITPAELANLGTAPVSGSAPVKAAQDAQTKKPRSRTKTPPQSGAEGPVASKTPSPGAAAAPTTVPNVATAQVVIPAPNVTTAPKIATAQNVATTSNAEQTPPKRKRKRKKNTPNLVEAQPAPKLPGAQQPYTAEQQEAGHSSRRSAIKKRLFEVDNINLPDGLPPVRPILESWPDSAPEKGSTHQKMRDLQNAQNAQRTQNAVYDGSKKAKSQPAEMIAAGILAHLRASNTPASHEHLMSILNVTVGEFISVVDSLMAEGKLFTTKKHKLALPEQIGLITGRLQATAKGFGFLLPDDKSADVFLPAASLAGALNGDKIVVRTVESRGNSREGEIVAITERANTRVVGTVEKSQRGYVLVPDSNKLAQEFPVPKGKLMGAMEKHKVVCDIVYTNNEQAYASVCEILGFATDIGTDVLSIIRQHNIPEEFTKAALNYARSVPEQINPDDISRREDLRNVTIVTIDGEDAKDLDDAISLEKLSNGHYMLGVHIADVSHYVKEGTPLDKDALTRATSVYFVDRVIPMLPKELSNGICSLHPAVDRLTLSCFMEIDGRGNVENHRFAETVINSKERLTYTDVTAALEGDESVIRKYAHIMPMFEQMKELCGILRARRDRRGSIDFDIPEAKIKVDAQGKPIYISMYPRGISNRIIEEFMLIANETVAAHMAYLEKPMMYRVHETPDTEKISELNIFLGSFGLTLKGAKGDIRPKTLQSIMLKTAGKPEEGIIARVMLRSLKKARYSEENLGHFGLAADNYCHFTSPIRRYPDLMVHRVVKELIHGQLTDKRCAVLNANMKGIADQCSERERAAMEAERDVDDLKKCEYMAGFLGQEFAGIISGVTSFGMFVELPNTCEGLVRMSDLKDDFYTFEEKNYRFVGRHTAKIFRLGDAVTVQVVAADVSTRRVDFALVESEPPHGRKAMAKPRGKENTKQNVRETVREKPREKPKEKSKEKPKGKRL